MKKIEIIKRAFSYNRKNARTSSAIIGFPQIEDCDKINAFYLKFAEKAAVFAKKYAEDKNRESCSLRIIPFIRYSGNERADFTFDVIISDDGKLMLYKRIAQSWSLEKQRLIRPLQKGEETFFDGKNYFSVHNMFGKINPRRMSDYITEKLINPRGKTIKKVENEIER